MEFMLLFGPAFVLMIVVAVDHWQEVRPRRRIRLAPYKSPLPPFAELPRLASPALPEVSGPGGVAMAQRAQSGMKP